MQFFFDGIMQPPGVSRNIIEMQQMFLSIYKPPKWVSEVQGKEQNI